MWRRTAASLATAVVSGIVATIDPLLIQRLIDTELPAKHMLHSLSLVAAIFGCLLGRFLLLFVSMYLNFTVEQDFAQSLRISILEQLNRLSAEYHEKTPTGDKLSRLERDVDQISELGSNLLTSMMRATVFFAANLFVMIRLNAAITLALVPAVFFFLWVRSHFAASLQQQADVAQGQAGRATSTLTEHLCGILQVQLLGAEQLALGKAVVAWREALTARRMQRSTELRYAGAVNAAVVLSTILVLAFGSVLTLRDRLTIGGLVAFYTCATRIFEPVGVAMEIYSRVQRVGASIRRVREILECNSHLPDLGQIVQPRLKLLSGISLTEVKFCYVANRPAIKGISLCIAPAASVAIVGPSGSGKSTIARLLVRLSDPHAGEISLDGRSFRDYSLAALRRTICYVPQQPFLFDGSIADNLLYANPKATDDDFQRVISITQLTSVIDRLPKGVDTQIGPSGYSLSGGERQRLALARALLREAPVLVMDESTSALDVATEHLVLEAITRRYQESTLIIISHRLPSIKRINRIVVLSHGRIAADGDHASLYSGCLLYRTLYESTSTVTVN
jgi:ABC-type bacteriocin/lantibiotic exporter with double-glycine peptidase domain